MYVCIMIFNVMLRYFDFDLRYEVRVPWDHFQWDAFSTELVSLTQEKDLAQSIPTPEVTSKNRNLCQVVRSWASSNPI